MLVHKIGNPVSKESKTNPRNPETASPVTWQRTSRESPPEEAPDAWSTDPLECRIRDYLQETGRPDGPRVPLPLSSTAYSTPPVRRSFLMEVEPETVREYKKYMQAPITFRETLVKWRKTQIQNMLQNTPSNCPRTRQLCELEHDFLGTLGFYGALKEKVLSPLLKMQVKE